MKERSGVALGDILPSRDVPIISMVAVSDDLEKVSFIVSGDVSESTGDGHCAPSKTHCEFLTLKEGQAQRFVYGPQESIRRVVVDDVREIVVDRRELETD